MSALRVEPSLLNNVLENPNDESGRLILADWFRENDQWDRGEFINVQIEYRKLYPHFSKYGFSESSLNVCPRCRRAKELSDLLLGRFAIKNGRLPFRCADDPYDLFQMGGYSGPAVEWDFEGGFVEEVRCPAKWWSMMGPSFLQSHPIKRVKIQDQTDFLLSINHADRPGGDYEQYRQTQAAISRSCSAERFSPWTLLVTLRGIVEPREHYQTSCVLLSYPDRESMIQMGGPAVEKAMREISRGVRSWSLHRGATT